MRSKREIVTRALEKGLEVSLGELKYVFSDDGELCFLVNNGEKLVISVISFNYFKKMCDELSDDDITEICFSSALREINDQ